MFSLGIDLGTTNSGVAFSPNGENAPVEVFLIPQLAAPGEVRSEPLLESCLYVSRPEENDSGLLDLPWAAHDGFACGRFAAVRGRETSGRLVSSAKSWLCQTGDERSSAILPLHAPEGVRQVSPLEASRLYLEHLRFAWEYENPGHPVASLPTTLTVPASFDAVARNLTERAARAAGFEKLVLLEEPQAALYAWIERHPDWRDHLQPGDSILVIDVGGGTTDLSLIAVQDRNGALALERIAVGDHLLLGGDNMDLALAHSVSARLASQGRKLDQRQMVSLWQQCRAAKERLFASPDSLETNVTLLGHGSGLIGGSITAKLQREEVERLLVDGFFPVTSLDDTPAPRRAGLIDTGLPYEPEPAITRHVAAFLRRAASSPSAPIACPSRVLFNGGVFLAETLRHRMMDVLNSWLASCSAPPAAPLDGGDLMLAVARGAAHYGRVRSGKGIRIRGGISRSYFIGIESSMPAVPGIPAPMKALCVASAGMEEGEGCPIPGLEFGLLVGDHADFRFFASEPGKTNSPGSVLDDIAPSLTELQPVTVSLPAGEDGPRLVRVTLETLITETGTLELWCVARDGRRWKLQFQVRDKSPR